MVILINIFSNSDNTEQMAISIDGKEYVLENLEMGKSEHKYELNNTFKHMPKVICPNLGTANVREVDSIEPGEFMYFLFENQNTRIFMVSKEELDKYFKLQQEIPYIPEVSS